MTRYNRLTEKLLADGYTAENYPKNMVHIANGNINRKDPLANIYGGFEYNRTYMDTLVFKTGCGMYVWGREAMGGMSYAGENWSHENNNPVIRCPYDKAECQENDPRLHGTAGGGYCIQCWCACHRTDEPYDYENSFKKRDKEREDEREWKYHEFVKRHHGRMCRQHAIYDERVREWRMRYEPRLCGETCFSRDGFCPILNKQLDKKKGNVYYELKTSGKKRYAGNQINMFEGEEWTVIEKGLKVFKKPVSLDICKAFVKVQSDSILKNWELNHHSALWFDKSLRAEVLNIRAEARESRDLMQDLQEIQAGCIVTHASDAAKRKAEETKEKREQSKKKKIEKLKKKLLTIGYQNLPKGSIDREHADKWLDPEQREELERMRQEKMKEEQDEPVQLTLFDMM